MIFIPCLSYLVYEISMLPSTRNDVGFNMKNTTICSNICKPNIEAISNKVCNIRKIFTYRHIISHSQMGHYFFSQLLTREGQRIEVLDIMGQMWQYVIFLSLKPTKATSVFILNYLKKVVGGTTTQIYKKTNTKLLIYSIWIRPQGSLGCQKN